MSQVGTSQRREGSVHAYFGIGYAGTGASLSEATTYGAGFETLAIHGERTVSGATASSVQEIPKAEQDYTPDERGDCQSAHGGQLVTGVTSPGENLDDEDHEGKTKEDSSNSHKSCSEA